MQDCMWMQRPIDRRVEGKSGIIEGEHSEDTKQSASSIRSLQQYDTDQAPRSSITIALSDTHIVKDAFLNMNIAEKLARMGVRIVTDEAVPEECKQ